jgi:competence protein ComEA
MWKDWLTFSKAERNGILILVILVCLSVLYPYFHQAFFYKSNPVTNPQLLSQVDSFMLELRVREKTKPIPFSFTDEETSPKIKIEPLLFDPNTVTSAQLVHLGFSKRQAAVIENFRSKGGVFRSSDDFAKMYVVDSSMFAKLKPYISINPSISNSELVAQANVEESIKLMINLNSADTIELIKLRGIGRGYARRIVAYRQLLGGFVDVNQLVEIYGFKADMVESLKPNVWVDTLSVYKINVNLVSYNDLKKHPYLNDYQARAIIFYRETKGNIDSLNEILENKLLDEKAFVRVKGYLTSN